MLSRANHLTKTVTRACSQLNRLGDSAHFRVANTKHPLIPNKQMKFSEADLGDHTGRLQNYIWTKDEISEKMKTLYRHVSHSISSN